jgi:Sec-independent protein translocase protein TatA
MIPKNRRGFVKKGFIKEYVEQVQEVKQASSMVIYGAGKITHSGVSTWKVFEGFQRRTHENSLKELLPNKRSQQTTSELTAEPTKTRHLNEKQQREIKKTAAKLSYYSKVREFSSKKSGKFKIKISFLTLTAPDQVTPDIILKAFDTFLDYLRRTVKAEYVWKKEIGTNGKHLHIHIALNQPIPYYIVSWKWKRALIAAGAHWSGNEKGKDTNSHTRIEIPRSKKLIAHYIAKYLSKGHELPYDYGYIWGKSEGFELCKEERFIIDYFKDSELLLIQNTFRTIRDQFITHTCVDMRLLKTMVPELWKIFERQFLDFQEKLCHPQKYFTI